MLRSSLSNLAHYSAGFQTLLRQMWHHHSSGSTMRLLAPPPP
jgi:hypothetical protein